MRKFLKYATLSFMEFCTLFVIFGVGRGVVTGWKKSAADRQSAAGMPRDIWLARFKSVALSALCTDSPLQRSLNGSHKECLVAFEPLFEHCATSKLIVTPAVIASREDAQRYGSLIGECIAANHFGGSYLEAFNRSLQMTKQP
ncbi:hypothetical protein XcmpCFBP7700_18420 [Xanthomonas campestris]|uniref:hypothetical protein n=1 Tax=Xanthomonas campestris TaxID=339 RepID=UPI0005C4AA30|nr:hypothetical protein [Xanthomonas campestris]MEB2258905.1 hypothetical protein [Xanthomonas campestris pv. campestris]MCW1979957.1 hypothetical protein [Xanthomonas campestris]MCW2003668.1 hypothetical protein [Xanthomonas campestris]MEA9673778.1 hypothetical protein [Xanthomonas campestris pv. raphani]MEA9775519.1 hypothetical protein [Xanthomonas campestris pv. raphani]